MLNNSTDKTLRLIAAGVYLKQMHGLEFALLVLTDAGLCDGVARAALQDERSFLCKGLTWKNCQNDDFRPE